MFNDTSGVYSARPVIEVNGEVQDQLGDSLLSLTVTAAVTEMSRLKARFTNWGMTGREDPDFLYFDGGLLAFGHEVKISFKDGDRAVSLFQGRITAIEGLYPKNSPPEIQIYAEDGLEALRHTRRSRTFPEAREADVFETIAAEYGLHTDFQNIPDHVQQVIAQLDQTDLDFLLGRSRRLGLDLWLDGNTLYIRARGLADRSRELTLGKDLLAFRVRADLAEQVTELGVTGWSVAQKEALDATADDRLVPVQLFGDQTGSAIIEQTFGERTERLARQVPLDRTEAQALADGQYLSRAYRFIIGEGEIAGRPDLRAGKTISIGGVGSWFTGVYHVTAVRHTFSVDQGLRTTFTAERPALGESASSSYGRIRRRKTRPQRPVPGSSPRKGKPPRPGKGSKPSPPRKPAPKPDPDKLRETRLADTTVHTVVDHQSPPEQPDDPAVTRPSQGIVEAEE